MWGYGLDRAGSGEGQVVRTCECGLAANLLASQEGLCSME